MTSNEFIVKTLATLVRQIPTLKVLYENQKGTDTHVVDVKPISMLNDRLFKAYEEKITFEFIKMFPSENIVFITPNSYTQIKNVEREFVGKCFTDSVNIYIPSTILEWVGHHTFATEVNTVYANMIDVLTFADSSKSTRATAYPQIGELVESKLVVKNLFAVLEEFSAANARGFDTSKIDDAGESNFAMAA
jgi:hypothetical protein